MSKKIIIATFGFLLVMCIAAQVVAVNGPDANSNLQDHASTMFRA